LSDALTPRSPVRHLAATYRRFRQVIHEGFKFGLVGLAGVAVTNLVFIPLHQDLHLGPLTSVTIALAAATVVTFLGNRYWSFRDRTGGGTGRESMMFFFLNGIGLLIQYAVLGMSNYAFGLTTKLENVIALNIGVGIGTLFRFWSYRKWVWLPPDVHLAQLRRGRHRAGRDLSAIPPAHRPTLSPPPAPAAARLDRTRPDLRDDSFSLDGLEQVRVDSLGQVPAADASEQRTPRTPAAG
jgi:putative flippase GtrA